MRQFAISDIHGCRRTFDALLEQIGLTKADELHLLGDLVDRGPDSRGVIDQVWRLRQGGYAVECLMGNHEQMLLNACDNSQWLETWMFNGGVNTLESFGVRHPGEIPSDYSTWLAALPGYLDTGDYLLVHAGLDFEQEDPLSDSFSLLWRRDWHNEIDYTWLGKRIIIHGHTPIDRKRIEYQFEQLDTFQVLNIDCGCVFNRRTAGAGYLCAFDMTNRRLFFQPNIEFAYA